MEATHQNIDLLMHFDLSNANQNWIDLNNNKTRK